MSDMSMIERVARAMQADAGQPADQLYWDTPCTGAGIWRSLAAAAIKAMREPSDQMLEAVGAIEIGCRRDCTVGRYRGLQIYEAAIDAALVGEG